MSRRESGKRWPKCSLEEQDIKTLNRKYPGFTFRLPTATENPGTWVENELCLFIEFFKDVEMLPLPVFLVSFCIQFKLVRAMLMPNTLIILRGLHGFFAAWKVPWSQESILSLITLILKEPGSYYAQPKHPGDFKMTGIPSSRHNWKERYVFVSCSKGWEINTIPIVPHKDAYRGWGTTKKIAKMLMAHGSKPFCINVETLEILSATERELKKLEKTAAKRKVGDVKGARTKKSKVKADNGSEAATDESSEGKEESIQWSEETQNVVETIRRVVSKEPKAPGIVIREFTTAAVAEEVAGKGKGKVEGVEASTSSSSDEASAKGGPSQGEEEKDTEATADWEWNWDSDDQIFSMNKNNRHKFLPDIDPAPLPLILGEIYQHPEDTKALEVMPDLVVGQLQTHLTISNLILGNALTSRLMATAQELEDQRAQFKSATELAECHKELAKRFEQESKSLGSIVQSQDAEFRSVTEDLKTKLATAIEESNKANAEVIRVQQQIKDSEERYRAEKAADILANNALKARVAELEKTLAEMKVQEDQGADIERRWKEEYKDSDEHQLELKDVSSYGFNLLRRVLKRENKLSSAELNVYDHDNCVLEDADGNIPK